MYVIMPGPGHVRRRLLQAETHRVLTVAHGCRARQDSVPSIVPTTLVGPSDPSTRSRRCTSALARSRSVASAVLRVMARSIRRVRSASALPGCRMETGTLDAPKIEARRVHQAYHSASGHASTRGATPSCASRSKCSALSTARSMYTVGSWSVASHTSHSRSRSIGDRPTVAMRSAFTGPLYRETLNAGPNRENWCFAHRLS